MKLFASANTTQNIGYTVMWLMFVTEEMSYTFDIQGWQDYKQTKFDIRFKGESSPWTLITEDGDEIDLFELEEEEVRKLNLPSLYELLSKGHQITLGLAIEASEKISDNLDRYLVIKNETFSDKYLRIELDEGVFEFSDFNIEIAGE